MKSYHGLQNIGYYVFDTVLVSNRINAKLKLLAQIPRTTLFQHFLKLQNHFPRLMYCITMAFTWLTEERCVHWVLKGEGFREEYESVRIKMLTISFNLKYVHTNKRAGVKEERRKRFLSSVNEACHCVWPGGSLLVLLFALLICMLMYLFYGSTVLIHFKINYPSGTPIPRAGSNVY